MKVQQLLKKADAGNLLSNMFLKKKESIIQQLLKKSEKDKATLEKMKLELNALKSENENLSKEIEMMKTEKIECKEKYEEDIKKIKEEKNNLQCTISQKFLKKECKFMEDTMTNIFEKTKKTNVKLRRLMDEILDDNRKLNDDVFAVEKKLKSLIKSLEELDNVESNNRPVLRRSSRNKTK